MSFNIELIKAAAEDMPALALEAGFRPSRIKAKLHCIGHEDKTPSAHLYPNGVHCYGCGGHWDAIDLERVIGGGGNGDALKRLANRYGVLRDSSDGHSRPPLSESELAEADLWHTGLRWHLERTLESLKAALWASEGEPEGDGQIAEFTRTLADVNSWTNRQAADALRQMRADAPGLALSCIAEARDAMTRLAAADRRLLIFAGGRMSTAKTLRIPADIARRLEGHIMRESPLPAVKRTKPAPLEEAAFHGITGEFVRMIDPHTEADPAAVALQFLAAMGIFVGRSAYYLAEGDRHYLNLFVAVVGSTSKGREGTSFGQVKRLLRHVDGDFCSACITSGISSGEGLIWAVRDPIREQSPIRDRGKVRDYQEVISDHGVDDKRLLIQEPEFARVLNNCARERNSASAIIREAWDTGDLNTLTKTQKARATGAHIGIIAHITAEELNRLLTNTEAANGFANRFLCIYSKRSKVLPFGGKLDESRLIPLAKRIQKIRAWAGLTERRIDFDGEAASDWAQVYEALSAGKPGLLGAAIGRAEAQVVRLSTLYAVLDESATIQRCHLQAALAVWDYAESAAAYIFGEALGDDTADSLLAFLRSVGVVGVTRTEISNNLFGRNKPAREIDRALSTLVECNLAYSQREGQTGGAPLERWFACTAGRA